MNTHHLIAVPLLAYVPANHQFATNTGHEYTPTRICDYLNLTGVTAFAAEDYHTTDVIPSPEHELSAEIHQVCPWVTNSTVSPIQRAIQAMTASMPHLDTNQCWDSVEDALDYCARQEDPQAAMLALVCTNTLMDERGFAADLLSAAPDFWEKPEITPLDAAGGKLTDFGASYEYPGFISMTHNGFDISVGDCDGVYRIQYAPLDNLGVRSELDSTLPIHASVSRLASWIREQVTAMSASHSLSSAGGLLNHFDCSYEPSRACPSGILTIRHSGITFRFSNMHGCFSYDYRLGEDEDTFPPTTGTSHLPEDPPASELREWIREQVIGVASKLSPQPAPPTMKTNPVPNTDHLVSAQFPALGGPFQPLLWIPEHSGNRTAFCSLNIARYVIPPCNVGKGDIYLLMGYDDNGCSRCAPFDKPVNPNCGTSYTIIPVTRTMSAELSDIGHAVADQLGKPPNHYDFPHRALRAGRLDAIAQVLAARDLLIATLIATDYHGKQSLFFTGMPVTHCTDDGQIFPGTVKSITDDGLLEITWPNGEEGWEEPGTCYLA